MNNDDCEICEEIESSELSVVDGMPTRIIHHEHGFVIAPTVGCLVEGYVLVMPERHVISFASLSDIELRNAVELLVKVRNLLMPSYGAMALFEHGMGPQDNAGGCVSHAHWHVFPSDISLDSKIRLSLPFDGPLETDELRCLAESPYLLFMPSDSNEFLFYKDPIGIKSQHVRRIIAAHSGIEESYDWAVAPFVDRMRQTFEVGMKALGH